MSLIISSCSFIVGPSGIGKGFGVGAVLNEFQGGVGFVTGDWCRKNQRDKANAGILVDDNVLVSAARTELQRELSNHSGTVRLYIDMPRSVAQATSYISIFRELGYNNIINTLLLDAPKVEMSIDRLLERAKRQGREDDRDPSVVNRRVSTWYGTAIKPVTDGLDYSDERNTDGLRHTLVPWLENNTDLYHLNPQCLEELRAYVQYELPHIVHQW